MMDMYFESSYDNMLSLDEMLDTDLKYSLELGLEVKDGFGSGPALASDDWGSWSLHNDGGASSYDFLASVDSSNGNLPVMVNPKSVIPSRLHSPAPKTQPQLMEFKTEPESEDEDATVDNDKVVIKQEVEEDDEEGSEDDEEEDGSDEEEEEDEREPERPVARELLQPRKKVMTATSVKVSQVSGKPRTMWLLSKGQVDKGPQIVNAGSLIKMKPSSDMMKAPSPTITSNGVQILKPNINKLKAKQMEPSKSPPSPIITSNGVQILKPNPNVTAKAKMQAQLSSCHTWATQMKSNSSVVSQFPKPAYSYSCLIAMALKNSVSGSLPVSEIYGFMCEHFPYFRTAPTGWKNSVRHNLSLNKCFEKIEKVTNGAGPGGVRKGCLWAMNPTKISKMDDEVAKWSRKDPLAIRRAMRYPDDLEKLERGEMKFGSISHAVEEESGDDEVPEEEESDENGEAAKRINMFELAHILRDEESTRAFLYDYKLLPQQKICPRCNSEMKLTFVNNFYGWFKCNNGHRYNAIKGTWFEGTHLGCREILLSTYCFLQKFSMDQTMAEVTAGKDVLEREVIVNWWYNTREVCIDAIEREYDELASLGPIGGVGCTVIVDKMKIGELNNSHRRIKDNVFILVMLEKGTGDYRIEVLEKLDYTTMMNHIVQNVETGTELLTEDWKGFSRLGHYGFHHKVLNDSERIPPDTLWFPHRQKLKNSGISHLHMGHYLYEYLWRREITRRDSDPFIALLQDVAKMHEI
uniref:Forkhead box protein N4 n=2 Tax=Lygus hesperus TaxID=30085 RepID=A0A0A9ZCH6_LYGHE